MPDHSKLDALRASLRRALPGVKSSHVAEAVARALGHRTNAALLASLGEGPEPDWVIDGPVLAHALVELGNPGIVATMVSRVLPSRSSWHRLDRGDALSPDSSKVSFAAYMTAHQSLVSTVIAQVFPHRFVPPRTGDMAWPHAGDVEAWTQVAHDGLMFGVGKGDVDAMRRRLVGWCVLATVVADALGLSVRADPDFVPVRQVALGGWKAAFRDGAVPGGRAWDDEDDHDARLPILRLPWPGAMGAELPSVSTFAFARAAGRSDVRWLPDAPVGEHLALSAFGHWIGMPDDPVLEATMRPLLDGGRQDHAFRIPGLPEDAGRLRVQVDRLPSGRRVTMRAILAEPPVMPRSGNGPGLAVGVLGFR